MNIGESIILGVVEGLTEFLPISSTFHLIVTTQILGLPSSDFVKMFEVVIQGGAISALLFIYTKTLLSDLKLSLKVALSFIPTAVVGAALYSVIKVLFFGSNALILSAFVLVGIIFLITEYLVKHKRLILTKSLADLSYKEALGVGFAQSLAVIPGVSRAGSVIVAMMGMGYKRDEAARYTFLLSLPTILAASLLDVYKNRDLLAGLGNEKIVLATGFITAFIVAYVVVKWLLAYLKSHTLEIFAWYRFAVTLLLLLTLWN
jgi:undecaprenyl-diphosphatase